jgi:hypothetical protein
VTIYKCEIRFVKVRNRPIVSWAEELIPEMAFPRAAAVLSSPQVMVVVVVVTW